MTEDAARQFGIEVETTSEEALLGALTRSLGYVIFYRGRVQSLPPDQLTYGAERVTRTRRPNLDRPGEVIEDTTVAKTTPHIYLVLLKQAEEFHFRVAAKIAELQIEAHRVRLAEEQATMFYHGILRIIERLGISPDDERIPGIISDVMGELAV